MKLFFKLVEIFLKFTAFYGILIKDKWFIYPMDFSTFIMVLMLAMFFVPGAFYPKDEEFSKKG